MGRTRTETRLAQDVTILVRRGPAADGRSLIATISSSVLDADGERMSEVSRDVFDILTPAERGRFVAAINEVIARLAVTLAVTE